MAKNFASIYSSGNDAVSLNQRLFVVEEAPGLRGVLSIPTQSDFLYHIEGASVNFSQPIESSPHKTDRHHSSIIKQKTSTEWTLPSLFNIDTTLGSASVAEIDPALRVLWKSLLGREQTVPNLCYDAAFDPSITFSIYENLDVMAKQTPGCAVEACNLTFPGDGQSQMEWSGRAKTSLYVGIGKSVSSGNDGTNTVTLSAGEGYRFPLGAKVMLIQADGLTRSLDTLDGFPRTVMGVSGDVVLLDGAALADANGSVGSPVYLCYYEPEEPFTAINNPLTGLEGSVTIAGLPSAGCVRSASFSITNSHEWEDYCFGKEGLGNVIFTPAGRLTVECTIELNLSKEMVGYMNQLREFTGEDITLVLGSSAGRRLQIEVPRAIFAIPSLTVPGTGTIPVSFTGNAYQSSLGAADEFTVKFL